LTRATANWTAVGASGGDEEDRQSTLDSSGRDFVLAVVFSIAVGGFSVLDKL